MRRHLNLTGATCQPLAVAIHLFKPFAAILPAVQEQHMSFAPGELLKLCTELLGGQFVDTLGDILDVNPRTIQRWLSDKQEVPPAIEATIRKQWSLVFEIERIPDRITYALTDIETAGGIWRPVIATQARAAAARFLDQDPGSIELDDLEPGPRPR